MTLEHETSTLNNPKADMFVGWYVVAALFVCTFSVFGVSIYSFIILTTPISQENGWDAVQTGSLVSAMWLVAPLALFSGTLHKFTNPWRLIAAGIIIQAAVLVSMTAITEFWQLYLLRIAMGFGKVLAVAAAPIIVARWFSNRFATAMAIVWAGGAAGGIVMSPLTEYLVSALSWRLAGILIAAGMILVGIVIFTLERLLSPPSNKSNQADGAAHPTSPAISYGSLLSSIPPLPALAVVTAVTGAGMAAIAVLSQQPRFLSNAGLSDSNAALILGITAIGCFIGSGSIGWCLDKFHSVLSSLLVSITLFTGLVLLSMLNQNTPSFSIGVIGAIFLGYGIGAGEVLWIAITKRQFGERAFPFTYGGWYFSIQLGYALGGGLGGWGLEAFGGVGFLIIVGLIYLPATAFSLILSGARRAAD
ncbi:MFS transporter [Hyphomonas sp.]|uniref:MFS transporter n=1 Tax=Hyphomonas sp. TaxID=87 RepID=UPI0032420071